MALYIFTTAYTKLNVSKATDMFGEAMKKAEQSQAEQQESNGGGSLDPESLRQRIVSAQVTNSFSAMHSSHISYLTNYLFFFIFV